jgi:hypothetical protein
VASTEIVLRSLALYETDVYIDDNEMYNFPILYRGLESLAFSDYFPIATNVVGFLPSANEAGGYGHMHVAPLPGYLFSYYLNAGLERRLHPLLRRFQGRALIAQLYVDGSLSSRYAMRLSRSGCLEIKSVRRDRSDPRARVFKDVLRKNLKGTPFFVPPFPLMRVDSSMHYTGGFGFQGDRVPVGAGCEIMPRVFAADSMTFPETPAQPLSFTIMANAMRVADLAISREN